MLKSVVALFALSMMSSSLKAAPEIVPVSGFPSTHGFVMESPVTDCRYDLDFANVTKSAEGSFGLFRKPGFQRISYFTCAIRIDNSKNLSEVVMWGNQALLNNNLNHIATCELHIASDQFTIATFPMTPVYSIPNAAVVQYKVDSFPNLNTAALAVTSAGIICDAQDGVSIISVLGLGVKYHP